MSIMSCQGVLPQQVLCLASFTSALSISYHQRIVSAPASAMCPIFAAAGLSQSQREAITPGLHHADFFVPTQIWVMCSGHMEKSLGGPSQGGGHGGHSLA